jgi:predicted nucleic acid-binding protein
MSAVVVDTDVVSFVFRNHLIGSQYDADLADRTLIVSFMTLAELDRWTIQSKWGEARRTWLRLYLESFVVMPYDRALCTKWAEVTVAAQASGYQDRMRGRPDRGHGPALRSTPCYPQSRRLSRSARPRADLSGAEDDIENPIETEGVCVGCLICSDARDFVTRYRVTEKVEKSVLARKVVCIPASMSAGTFDSPSFPLPEYRNKYVLMANGKPSPPVGAGSFIANKCGSKINGSNFAD